MFWQSVLVFVGAGLGGLARWMIGRAVFLVAGTTFFPAGTLIANLLACAGAGLLALAGTQLSADLRLLLFTGFLGGLSTMSTFSYETVQLLKMGAWQIALLNLLLTLIVCLGIIFLILLPADKGI
ncbi:MAG: CrcB family protein [Opitutales bacterium]|nr:CrcB family protein [Opitutales bacterium]